MATQQASRIGVVQMCSGDDVAKNLAFAQQKIRQAAEEGLDLVAFPETFLYVGQDHKQKHQLAQRLDDEFLPLFREWARQHHLSILLGSVYEPISTHPHQLYNTALLIDQYGELIARYRKIHLCDAPALGYHESAGIKAGDMPVVVAHDIGTIGLSICYDLRFPELFRYMALQGAQIIFVPAAFFLYTGQRHWMPLLTARAIENQVYIVAPNQWGQHYEGRTSCGRSTVIDPWGNVISCASEREELISAHIDLDYLQQVRSTMPALAHSRPAVYEAADTTYGVDSHCRAMQID